MIYVAVIGAGPAGLAALRHLSAKPEIFSVVAFEQSDNVGGTWVYTDNVGTDDKGNLVHSSMYTNLRTNLPKEVMAFPDFPFARHLPSFITHQDVRQYLMDYTEKFNIRQYIKFNTRVNNVIPITQDGATKWHVSYRCFNESSLEEVQNDIFDAVMICTGHNSQPKIPDIAGLDTFPGHMIHSHDYRKPASYRGQRVLCLGAGASGQDIAVDIAPECKQVILSHAKATLKSILPENLSQAPWIKEVREKLVIFTDGSQVEVDAIIICTGYRYHFPFLSPKCNLNITKERITPLYKHVIHTEFPTLSLLGMAKVVLPLPHIHCQVKFFLAALDGSMKLPSREEMDKETEADYQWRLSQGIPHRNAHTMAHLQWDYNDELARTGHFEPIPDVIRKLYDDVIHQRNIRLMTYRSSDYQLTETNTYTAIPLKS